MEAQSLIRIDATTSLVPREVLLLTFETTEFGFDPPAFEDFDERLYSRPFLPLEFGDVVGVEDGVLGKASVCSYTNDWMSRLEVLDILPDLDALAYDIRARSEGVLDVREERVLRDLVAVAQLRG